jgi:hypothetical protein
VVLVVVLLFALPYRWGEETSDVVAYSVSLSVSLERCGSSLDSDFATDICDFRE